MGKPKVVTRMNKGERTVRTLEVVEAMDHNNV